MYDMTSHKFYVMYNELIGCTTVLGLALRAHNLIDNACIEEITQDIGLLGVNCCKIMDVSVFSPKT